MLAEHPRNTPHLVFIPFFPVSASACILSLALGLHACASPKKTNTPPNPRRQNGLHMSLPKHAPRHQQEYRCDHLSASRTIHIKGIRFHVRASAFPFKKDLAVQIAVEASSANGANFTLDDHFNIVDATVHYIRRPGLFSKSSSFRTGCCHLTLPARPDAFLVIPLQYPDGKDEPITPGQILHVSFQLGFFDRRALVSGNPGLATVKLTYPTRGCPIVEVLTYRKLF